MARRGAIAHIHLPGAAAVRGDVINVLARFVKFATDRLQGRAAKLTAGGGQ